MKTIKDYHDLYLKCDVLLLVDAFEKFRTNSLINYGISLSQHFSASALSWGAMLSMTKFGIELSSDPNMYLVFEKGMTSGVSYISKRYSKASNKYLKSYNPKQESRHKIYLDANNLYGYGMSKLFSSKLIQMDRS